MGGRGAVGGGGGGPAGGPGSVRSHLSHHQVGPHHQEAHEGDQVGQLHRRLQPLSQVAQQRRLRVRGQQQVVRLRCQGRQAAAGAAAAGRQLQRRRQGRCWRRWRTPCRVEVCRSRLHEAGVQRVMWLAVGVGGAPASSTALLMTSARLAAMEAGTSVPDVPHNAHNLPPGCIAQAPPPPPPLLLLLRRPGRASRPPRLAASGRQRGAAGAVGVRAAQATRCMVCCLLPVTFGTSLGPWSCCVAIARGWGSAVCRRR